MYTADDSYRAAATKLCVYLTQNIMRLLVIQRKKTLKCADIKCEVCSWQQSVTIAKVGHDCWPLCMTISHNPQLLPGLIQLISHWSAWGKGHFLRFWLCALQLELVSFFHLLLHTNLILGPNQDPKMAKVNVYIFDPLSINWFQEITVNH